MAEKVTAAEFVRIREGLVRHTSGHDIDIHRRRNFLEFLLVSNIITIDQAGAYLKTTGPAYDDTPPAGSGQASR